MQIKIRRFSGGGAVYHDEGNLNFSVITSQSNIKRIKYYDLILKAVEKFGIKAEFNGRNDLITQDKKFSGNAIYSDGKIICRHGTILISSNLDNLSKFLTPDINKLSRNHVKSIQSRVINLNEISNAINIEAMRNALIELTGAAPLLTPVNEHEILKHEHLFSSEKWIYGGIYKK